MNNLSGVSVIVCCYNSANRLPRTIEYLAKQIVPVTIPWEVVLVDNASTDNTKEIAIKEWQKYKKDNIPFIIVDQPKPGLSFAREKGIEDSKYDVLIFCDDDNWLDENYIQNAYTLISSNDKIGALGGWGRPVSDVSIPEWFIKNIHSFANFPQGECDGELTDVTASLYGAGLVLKKSAWVKLRSVDYRFILTDRKGATLTSGGDTELSFALRILGYKLWYSSSLQFQHFMPKERLTETYFVKLNKALAFSGARLLVYNYVLTNKKVDHLTWLKDFFYKTIIFLKSCRVLFLRIDSFEKIVSINFSLYSMLGMLSMLGKYQNLYFQLKRMERFR